jgi:long-subunit acyl-CoA synthetase (AMP-forming)
MSYERYADDFIRQMNAVRDPQIVDRSGTPINTLKEMLEASTLREPKHTAFYQKFPGDKEYTEISYAQTLKDVNALGTALLALGLKDKRVAVIGENGYHWAISYLATTCGVGVIVPLDKELSKGELLQLLENAEASCVIFAPKFREIFAEHARNCGRELLLVETGGRGERAAAAALPAASAEGTIAVPAGAVLRLEDLIAYGSERIAAGDHSYLKAEVDPEAMSVLLFTSGTTGIAKGVMLSQKNLCVVLMSASFVMPIGPQDLFFSVLPAHHIYEGCCGFLLPLYRGASIGYCEGLKYIQKNLQELHPTFFLGVPLIFEKLYNAIWKNIRKKGKEETVRKLLRLNRKTLKMGLNLSNVFLKEILAVFGGRMHMLVSGGAAIDPEILQFFNDLGINAVQGYGLSECAPLAAVNPGKRSVMRNASVGYIMPMDEVKIRDAGEDGVGEICIKGPNVMLGYYKMPEATAEALQDGWFCSGDLGYVEDKYIYITGRKKNVIITANGKNVYPEELEYYLSRSRFIEESMVWARNDEAGHNCSIVATVRPDRAELQETLGHEPSEAETEELIRREVDEINQEQPLFKRVDNVVIRSAEFEKNSSKKIRRNVESNRLA